MKADTPGRRKGSTAIDHPALAESPVTVARSLDRRAADDEALPSYLDLAVLVADVQSQLDDLTRQLVHYARRYERTTWKDIGETFGISRPTVYKRSATRATTTLAAIPEAEQGMSALAEFRATLPGWRPAVEDWLDGQLAWFRNDPAWASSVYLLNAPPLVGLGSMSVKNVEEGWIRWDALIERAAPPACPSSRATGGRGRNWPARPAALRRVQHLVPPSRPRRSVSSRSTENRYRLK